MGTGGGKNGKNFVNLTELVKQQFMKEDQEEKNKETAAGQEGAAEAAQIKEEGAEAPATAPEDAVTEAEAVEPEDASTEAVEPEDEATEMEAAATDDEATDESAEYVEQ